MHSATASSGPPQPTWPRGAQPVTPARPRRVSRRLAVIVAVLAIGVTGVAIAANQLISTDEVAQSLPAGTLALAGTNPTCTVVTKDVEFHCVLAKATGQRGHGRQGQPGLEGHRRAERRREQARQRRLPLAHGTTGSSGSATSARPRWTRRSSARASSESPCQYPARADRAGRAQSRAPGVRAEQRLGVVDPEC